MKQNLIRVAAGLLALGAIVLGIELFRVSRDIRRQSNVDEARPADVILVLGAAEYRGKPSPILEARLKAHHSNPGDFVSWEAVRGRYLGDQ